jgi:hypothetical protein
MERPMMDNVELTQEILNLLADNTEDAEEAIFIIGLVLTKICLVQNMAVPALDAKIARYMRLVREEEAKELQ